jgi:replicative superfamily II helicase
MPPLTQVSDQTVCVATSEYPYASWKFEQFNPVQSRIMDFYNQDNNGLVAASTSAGKTVVAEMFLADEVRRRGGKGMFLAPLRALAREKITDWTDPKYHFSDLKISICTGDYRLTKERASELNDANLIVMTSEMLSHRSRNHKSEQNNFLLDVGTLVVDESHLLTVPGRGDHLEVGLMKFTKINPNVRLVLLSATMPNVEEIAEWVSYSLNQKQTFVLRSSYRPVPLTVHYEPYANDIRRYDLLEMEKINKALDIIEWYKDDKFLVFSHTKRTGELMKNELKSLGIDCEFHNADLDSAKRAKVEDRFKNDPKFRVIVATSTLAWGMNMPARRVIILGVHRGVDEVESHDILQMIGRSGRYGIDPMGDAYILVPESDVKKYKQKYAQSNRIESQLLQKSGPIYKVLAFHLVSEIFHGEIETTDDVHEWYKRSLAYFQNKSINDSIVDGTLEILRKCGAIVEVDGKWQARTIGKVSSMFYMSPFDVADLYFNFKNLFDSKRQDDEYCLAMALGNIDSQRQIICSKAEKDEMSLFGSRARLVSAGKYLNDGAIKAGFCYFNLLSGNNSQACASYQRNLQFDFNRLSQVLQALDSLSGQWNQTGWIKNLEERIMHGVPAHLISLCKLSNIGKVRATKLYDAGIKTKDDFLKKEVGYLSKLLNMKADVLQQIIQEAKSTSMNNLYEV